MDVPVLNQLCQYAVGEQDAEQPGEIACRQSFQTDGGPKRGEGNQDASSHDEQGQSGYLPGGTALYERHFPRTYHVYNQCLRQQAFDEPSGLEEGLMLHALTAEGEPHHQISDDVEDGTDGTDENHEAAQVGGIPFPGFPEVFRIHPVEGDGGLRNIIQQVLNQQMNGKHGQEGQESTGCHDTEHVAEIGTGGHLDVFGDVAEGLSSFQYPVFQYHQAFFQQDDVGTFLGDVYG